VLGENGMSQLARLLIFCSALPIAPFFNSIGIRRKGSRLAESAVHWESVCGDLEWLFPSFFVCTYQSKLAVEEEKKES
jgi:hypothetical protein